MPENSATKAHQKPRWFLSAENSDPNKLEATFGPFTSEEIQRGILDGTLQLQSPIFDSETGRWQKASDVVPLLQLPEAEPQLNIKSSSGTAWNPPPRPAEYKDFHVVDRNIEPTLNIDYFALIGDRKKELAKKVRTEKSKRKETTAKKKAPAEITGVTINEVETGSSVIDAAKRFSNTLYKYRMQVSVAASLGFVFVGSFYVVKMLAGSSQKTTRDPAAKVTPQEKPTKPQSAAPSVPDSLGSGQHKKAKQVRPIIPPVQTIIAPTPTPYEQPRDQGREIEQPAQVYESPNPLLTPADPGQPPMMPPMDPSLGTVTPPGYVPPPGMTPGLGMPPNMPPGTMPPNGMDQIPPSEPAAPPPPPPPYGGGQQQPDSGF